MTGRKMVAIHSHSSATKFAFAILIALVCGLSQTSSVTHAAPKKPNFGIVEITTTPAPYPLTVDGQPDGETSTTGRTVQLQPGHHTVDVLMPNGSRWTREFDVLAGRKNCIVLAYKPKTITIEKSPCPYPVNVSAPRTVNDGDTITYTSDVAYGGASALNYTWTVSPATAKIVSGAGTPTITVDSTGLGAQRVTAILVVDDGSGDRICRQTAQAATNIIAVAPPSNPPRRFAEFPSIAFDDDKANLDNFGVELQGAPDAQGYMIIYGGRTSRTGQADRLGERAKNYMVRERGLDASRLMVVNGGYRDTDMIELWVVPRGAQTPQPTPTVQPSEARPAPDVRPTRRTRRRRRG